MPIPPDLWSILARLDPTCEMKLSSELVPQPGEPPRRIWRMTIRPRAGGPTIDVTAMSATTALAAALDRAELQGWPDSLSPEPEPGPSALGAVRSAQGVESPAGP